MLQITYSLCVSRLFLFSFLLVRITYRLLSICIRVTYARFRAKKHWSARTHRASRNLEERVVESESLLLSYTRGPTEDRERKRRDVFAISRENRPKTRGDSFVSRDREKERLANLDVPRRVCPVREFLPRGRCSYACHVSFAHTKQTLYI